MLIRHRHLALVACVCAALLSTACKGRDKHNETSGEVSAPPAAVDGMAAVPSDAEIIVFADVTALAKHPLARRAVSEALRSDPELGSRIGTLLSACELTPGERLQSIAVGLKGQQAVLVASGSFNEGELAACVGRAMSQRGGTLEIQSSAGRTVYKAISRSGAPVFFALGSTETLVASASREWLDTALTPTKQTSILSAELSKVNRSAALWAVGRFPPEVASGLVGKAGVKQPPRSAIATLDVREGLSAKLRVELASQSDADVLATALQNELALAAVVSQKAGLGPITSKLEISTDGPSVIIQGSLSQAELDGVATKLGLASNPAHPAEKHP